MLGNILIFLKKFFFFIFCLIPSFPDLVHCAHWSNMSRNILIFFFNFFPFLLFFFILSMVCLLPPLQILHNLLADRPAPRGAAGMQGGGPPCKSKKTTFKFFKKKQYYCSLHGLNQSHIWLQSQKIWSKKCFSKKNGPKKICPKKFG